MLKIKTIPFDVVDYFKTPEDIAAYLEAAFEDGDPRAFRHVLGNVARANGVSGIARTAGVGRESLYKPLSTDGTPELTTLLKVV